MTYIHPDVPGILEIEHEITIKNTDEFRERMEKFLLESGSSLILDLDKVMYLNSSALGIIAHSAMSAKQHNKELVIAGIKPPINEIFEIVKFNAFMELFATRQEALEYFNHQEPKR
ncbi:STAS domain-containing protein [Paenibacillus sp. YPG26]|uniref:STAS domain-containing protein n=1 Tax=Paenibacillus sp. YPG26 TaxID=2878915 RepID=UPI002041772C|nr:STAS domain-containing protein [Paenibacillus sp. YPG26]USB31747.1 STAS domain-containing protein [Paenibacillus sp. YPG26]